uniref:Secreted protein n=1 Tax=Macrostomum lignano TaxID=282301 RepID=A0A1I8FK57_9PLAT
HSRNLCTSIIVYKLCVTQQRKELYEYCAFGLIGSLCPGHPTFVSPSSRRQFNIQADSRSAPDEALARVRAVRRHRSSGSGREDELLARQIDQQRRCRSRLCLEIRLCANSRRFPRLSLRSENCWRFSIIIYIKNQPFVNK